MGFAWQAFKKSAPSLASVDDDATSRKCCAPVVHSYKRRQNRVGGSCLMHKNKSWHQGEKHNSPSDGA
eukprot:13412978-Ditylum_brightwellii.AAC.1